VKHLSVEAVGRLIEAADTDRNRLFLSVIYQHGLRVSEALALTRGSVKRGYLQIKAKKNGKRADERIAPPTLALWERVTHCLLPTTLVFPFSRQWGSSIFHECALRAKIELQLRCGIHSLRHSLAHHMLDSGAPLPAVQRSLRHKSIGSTGQYLVCDQNDADQWRAKAIYGAAAASAQPMSLAHIQAEITRLSKLALSMQDEAEAAKRRLGRVAMAVEAEATGEELRYVAVGSASGSTPDLIQDV
jgi:integrase